MEMLTNQCLHFVLTNNKPRVHMF